MKTIVKKENQKESKRKGYESILLLLLTISLFVTATYAWFTDSAYSKGNKIFTGNMYVDVIIKEEDAIEQLVSKGVVSDEEEAIAYLSSNCGDYKYERRYDALNSDVYYRVSVMPDEIAKNFHVAEIYNIEPGQYRIFNVDYLNSGDLAFKTAGALKIDLDEEGYNVSLTGLEVLNEQYLGNYGVYKNNYALGTSAIADYSSNEVEIVTDNEIDPKNIFNGKDINGNDYDYFEVNYNDPKSHNPVMSYEEYEYRFMKYVQMEGYREIRIPALSSSKTESDVPFLNSKGDDVLKTYYLDEGVDRPCLEDVLEVYATTDIDIIKGEKASEYYFGTVTQFNYLMLHGPEATADLTINDELQRNYSILFGDVEEVPILKADPTEEETKDELKHSLYLDYQRYLKTAGGFCLPIDCVKDDNDFVPEDGVSVKIYEKTVNDKVSSTVENVKEIGSNSFTVYMPTDVDSRYQNASISLSVGVTATQTAYEVDDTGCMIYDNVKPEEVDDDGEKIFVGDLISIDNEIQGNTVYFRVLDIDGDNVTIALCSDSSNSLEGNYESDDETTTFEQLSNGLIKGYESYNYKGSSLEKAINTDYSNFVEAFPSIKDSLVEVDTTQYYFHHYEMLETLFDSSNSISNSYVLGSMRYERMAYNNIGNLKSRALSITDIFECLNKIGVELNSDNIKRLIAYNPNSSEQGLILPYKIPLMDVSDNGFYYIRSDFFTIEFYQFDLTTNAFGIFSPLSVFTFDRSTYDKFTYVESFDGTKRTGDDDDDSDKVVIGIVSSAIQPVSGDQSNATKYLNEAVETRLNKPCEFEVITKYLGNSHGKPLVAIPQQQLDNAKSLINDSKAKYLVVETLDGTLRNEISEYAESKGVKVFYLGYDYPVNVKLLNMSDNPYLANSYDYAEAVSRILYDKFNPNQENIGLNFSLFYSSDNPIASDLYGEFDSYLMNHFSDYKNYELTYAVSSANELSEGDYEDVFNKGCNIILCDYPYHLSEIKSKDTEPDDHVYIYYLDNIDSNSVYPFKYYGIYYNYDVVCSDVLETIIADINQSPQLIHKIKLMTYKLYQPEER